MSFPAAALSAIGLLAVGIISLAAILSGIQWVVCLATRRNPAPRWMGVSDWAGPIFLCAVSAVGVATWLAFR